MKKKVAAQMAGFTLLEIMVAILLLAVLAIGGAAALYRTGGSIQAQGNKRIAVELANKVLEEEKATPYLDIVTSPSSDETSTVVDGIPHTIAITRTRYTGPSIADEFKRIEVEVTQNNNISTDTVYAVTEITYK